VELNQNEPDLFQTKNIGAKGGKGLIAKGSGNNLAAAKIPFRKLGGGGKEKKKSLSESPRFARKDLTKDQE